MTEIRCDSLPGAKFCVRCHMGEDNAILLEFLRQGTWGWAVVEDRLTMMAYDRNDRIHTVTVLSYSRRSREEIRAAICELADRVSDAGVRIHT